MTELTEETAYKIMALVDDCPSEPFSFERRQIIQNIIDLLSQAWSTFEDEASANYDIGYENGYDEGKYSTEEDYERSIEELHDRIDELESDLEAARNEADDAFAKGYETASREGGGLESFELR